MNILIGIAIFLGFFVFATIIAIICCFLGRFVAAIEDLIDDYIGKKKDRHRQLKDGIILMRADRYKQYTKSIKGITADERNEKWHIFLKDIANINRIKRLKDIKIAEDLYNE